MTFENPVPDPDFAAPPIAESIMVVNYVPSGACSLPNSIVKSTSVAGPGLYQCVPDNGAYSTGTWQKIGAGTGNIAGTVAAGYMPIATALDVLGNGPIDFGVTFGDFGLIIDETATGHYTAILGGDGGIYIDTVAGEWLPNNADGPIQLDAGTDLHLHSKDTVHLTSTGVMTVASGTALSFTNTAGALAMRNNGDGGTSISDAGAGGLIVGSTNGIEVAAGQGHPNGATLLMHNEGTGGVDLNDIGGGGVQVHGTGAATLAGDTSTTLLTNGGPSVSLTGGASAGILIQNAGGPAGTQISDTGGGGIQASSDWAVTLHAANNIQIEVDGSGDCQITAGSLTVTAPKLSYAGILVPTTIYAAAGTPLPAAGAGLKGAQAVVSDATLPTFLSPYVSGGAVVASVLCDGTQWVTA